MVVCGRTDQQIREDALCELHTQVLKSLDMRTSTGYVIVGSRRTLLSVLKADVESAMFGKPTSLHSAPDYVVLQHRLTKLLDRA